MEVPMVSVEPVEPHEDVAAHDAVSVDDYQPASNLLRALTAPVRLALIDVLADGPRCVHDLVDTLGIAQPLVSQHLKVLRAARLVGTKSRGREVVYLLTDAHVAHIVRDALHHAAEDK
jgi:DNA-binding transcriptional ArsR family regulator